jgi:hypothetical protein
MLRHGIHGYFKSLQLDSTFIDKSLIKGTRLIGTIIIMNDLHCITTVNC